MTEVSNPPEYASTTFLGGSRPSNGSALNMGMPCESTGTAAAVVRSARRDDEPTPPARLGVAARARALCCLRCCEPHPPSHPRLSVSSRRMAAVKCGARDGRSAGKCARV
jgi:hypothetical protein